MDLSRGQKLLVIVGLLALLAGIVVLSLGRLGARPAAVVYEAPAIPAASLPQRIFVDVAGAVVRPGLYPLPPASRVNDALALAGGVLPEADPASVNRAAILKDGQQVKVLARVVTPPEVQPPVPPPPTVALPSPAPAPPLTPVTYATSQPPLATGPVSLSRATKEQLESLQGIGPDLAAKILYYRSEHGPFSSVDELTQVEGIGAGRLEKLRPYVRP